MNQHYRIGDHIATLKWLRSRTHEWGFRGVERRIMMIVLALKLCFPSFWIRHYADIRSNRLRNKLIEEYVLLKTMIMLIILICGWWSHWIALVITFYFLADLITYLLGLVTLSNLNHTQPNLRRNLILLGINMLELVSAFSIFYLGTQSLYYAENHVLVTSWIDGIYYSIATFATVGYGDLITVGSWWHLLSTCQILTSFLFISLVLSSVVSKLELNSEW